MEEEKRLEEARLAEEAALAIAEKEKEKSKAAIEAAEAQKRIAELESQKRLQAEMKALKEAEEKRKVMDALVNVDVRYRKYTIEEIEAATEFFSKSLKIGEGGYGPVFKCLLDHTPVAVKVLRPDAAQGRSQFQREVSIQTKRYTQQIIEGILFCKLLLINMLEVSVQFTYLISCSFKYRLRY
jgi:nucleoredoxin